MTHHPSRRRGFTQVEILVTIAIILTIVSLILPAIKNAREVARGSQCKDNLHNLAIAADNYCDQFGVLPAGVLAPHRPVRSAPGGDGLSWVVRLLPFMEQKPLYDLVDWTRSVEGQDAQVRSAEIDVVECPAVGIGYGRHPAVATYAGCHHQVEAPIDVDNHGLFVLGRGLPPVEIVDGASHTLLMAEKDVPADDRGWLSGGRATLRNTGAGFVRPAAGAGAAASSGGRGDPLAVGSFSSPHPWGVNVALADGAVRLMSFDSDPALLQRLADRADGELVSVADFLPDYAYPAGEAAEGRSP